MKKFALLALATLSVSSAAMAYQCSYEVVAGRFGGRVIDVITVGSDFSRGQACKKASVACEGMLRSRYSHIRDAFCSPARGGGYDPRPVPPRPFPPYPGRDYVTRTCQADLMERGYYSDYRVQTFTATSTGLRGTGVKATACNEARRECEFSRRYNQYCVVDR